MKPIIIMLICIICMALLPAAVFSQSFAINTDGSTAHPSAMLDIKSSTKGILIPRTSTTTRIAIPAPAKGLMIYDTTTNSFWYYDATTWNEITAGNNGWSLTGNAGTDTTIHFIGTTDANDLVFKTNNIERMALRQNGTINLTAVDYNTSIGDSAGANNTGQWNHFVGYHAGANNTTGQWNHFNGANAGYSNTTGDGNYFDGFGAGYSNTTGSYNHFSGVNAGLFNTMGYDNYFSGVFAGLHNSTAGKNIAIGTGALEKQSFDNGGTPWETTNVAIGYEALNLNDPTSTSNGISNTAVGTYAMRNNTTGFDNTALGAAALYTNNTGIENTAIGRQSLFYNTTGSGNTAMGYKALRDNSIGFGNNAIGRLAMTSNTTGSINTAIGTGALYSQSFNNAGSVWYSYNVAVGQQALYACNSTSVMNGIYNTAVGAMSLAYNTIGRGNTANGLSALYKNTTASQNTAIGTFALFEQSFSNGGIEWESNNVAVGFEALAFNAPTTTSNGISNTAVGAYALTANTTGFDNTAVGAAALYTNIAGVENTALGRQALFYNTYGNDNTAGGYKALRDNSIGANNTAFGANALKNNNTGNYNSAFGYNAGPNTTTISNTTCIGNGATATASNQLVLGDANVTQFYCYGAYAGTTAFAANLYVSNSGQILRSTSSARYKKDIMPIDINTANIYKLNPVSYNSYTDTSRHFGLIAEEVAEVIPELAMYSKEKDVVKESASEKMIPDAVQYPLLSVLILKEVQKHEQTIIEQQKLIEEMKKLLLAQQQQSEALLKRLELLEKKN